MYMYKYMYTYTYTYIYTNIQIYKHTHIFCWPLTPSITLEAGRFRPTSAIDNGLQSSPTHEQGRDSLHLQRVSSARGRERSQSFAMR